MAKIDRLTSLGRVWRRFDRQQFFLPLHAPAIAAQAAVFAHHAMTRNGNRHWIGCARTRYGARCFRLSDVGGDLAVRFRRAARNCLQLLPDTPLERGGLNVQRKRHGCDSPSIIARRAFTCPPSLPSERIISAFGYSLRSSRSRRAAESPNWIEQTPRSVAASSICPIGVAAMA